MKKSLLASAAGMLLIACSGMQKPAPPAFQEPAPEPLQELAREAVIEEGSVVAALEQACLSEPMNAARWQRLAMALEADGQQERAQRMFEQAATLRAHDVRRDYALLREAAMKPRAAVMMVPTMARTEVRQVGAAMVQVVRVPASLPAQVSARAPTAMVDQPSPLPVRLEISNGNGIPGAAARMARSLSIDGVTTVRLTNVKNFAVPRGRIEYLQEQEAVARSLSQRLGLPLKEKTERSPRADMRIVLGHDAVRVTQLK